MFEIENQKYINLLGVNVKIYNESSFGCKHVHFESKDEEKVFMVAFRTVPEDSTGVAHILEHTALCGSKRFPVRDPFFMMLRRSLNTFMNAFTSSDWTAYPFSTKNQKDFNNLLDVYLDAAFFPNLDLLDFYQEGHRLEFAKKDDVNSNLSYKGVVYNEMKGAMSSISSQLWHGMSEHLYEKTTYKHNSGGNPEDILNLTHDDLIKFHKTHYHPSNAIFYTFGNLNPKEIQNEIKEKVLTNFSPTNATISVKNENKINQPKKASSYYQPLPNDEDNHHLIISWLLEESHSPVALLESYLLSNFLLDNSASPLRKVLEKTELGKSLSPITGLSADQKEMVFIAGLEGIKSNNLDNVEELILKTIEDISNSEIDDKLIDSSIHQLEIKQKEISGGMPFGLQIMLSSMNAAIHRDNIINSIDLDSAFKVVKKNFKKKNYLQELLRKNLINNKHRLTYTLIPDSSFNTKQDKKINNRLNNIKKSLTKESKQEIVSKTIELENRQNMQDDPEILPKVTKDDIPLSRSYPECKIISNKNSKNYIYSTGTNGILYHSLYFPCKELSEIELSHSSFYADLITNLGHKSKSYEEIQQYQSSKTGGISASFSLIPTNDDKNYQIALKISGKCLEENSKEMQRLLIDTIENVKFNESKRIEELIEFSAASNEKSIVSNGHILAMSNASSQINNLGSFMDSVGGINFIRKNKILIEQIKNDQLNKFTKILESIKSKILNEPIYAFTASSDKNTTINNCESNSTLSNQRLSNIQEEEIGWLTSSQISFCSQVFQTVTDKHEDAPYLAVLGAVLRNGYLHSAIREKGGAYGAGASQDSSIGIFKFFSYRDPQCVKTFDEFNNALKWSKDKISEKDLNEGVLNVISSIDKPLSPSGEAFSDFNNMLNKNTIKDRLLFRQKVISCSKEDLIRVAEKYLINKKPKRCVIAGEIFADQIQSLGLKIKNI